jgi:glutamate 5-kinase
VAGRDVGTCFVASERRLTAKRSWIAFTLRPRGEIVLDRGAVEAVCARGRSVLPVGVLGVRGDFRVGDSVRLLDPDGLELGRGLARAAAVDAVALAGKAGGAVLVHRDDMVIWPVPEQQ